MISKFDQEVKDYKPSKLAKELICSTSILFLVGPTGAGKDSLKELLLKTKRYHHIVSHTTRSPRINHGVLEQEGREYHFITEKQAEAMLKSQKFIELKHVHNNIYGTSLDEIASAKLDNKVAMTDLDVQGVSEYKALDPKVIAVFLLPPDFKIWQERLNKRYGDVVDAQDYRLRLQTALKEIDELLNTDHYIAVINEDLEQTFKEVNQLVGAGIYKSADDTKARKVAKQLEKDIKHYLAK